MDEIILEISGNCNLDCIMCGYGRSKTKEKKLMTRKMFEHVIEHYCEGIRTLRLNACGESTIHPEFKELLSYARQTLPDVDIKLFSNINYRDPSISKAIVDADVQLIMSIDSVDRDRIGIIRRGSDYDTIMRNENMAAYNEAKDEFDAIMQRVTAILQASAQGEDPDTADVPATLHTAVQLSMETCSTTPTIPATYERVPLAMVPVLLQPEISPLRR